MAGPGQAADWRLNTSLHPKLEMLSEVTAALGLTENVEVLQAPSGQPVGPEGQPNAAGSFEASSSGSVFDVVPGCRSAAWCRDQSAGSSGPGVTCDPCDASNLPDTHFKF